ncbi:MAG: hypothetical protein AB1485_09905, partial [Candidatus Thermoplasmatota archaeon]
KELERKAEDAVMNPDKYSEEEFKALLPHHPFEKKKREEKEFEERSRRIREAAEKAERGERLPGISIYDIIDKETLKIYEEEG